MTATRDSFDGRAFIPREPVSAPEPSDAVAPVGQDGPTTAAQLDAAVRACYQNQSDADEEAWGAAAAPDSRRAWDED